MRQTKSPSRPIDQADAPRGPRLGDSALACLLALGLFVTALAGGDDESYVVSIADLDTAIVLSLLEVNHPAQDFAGASAPAEAAPARAAAAPLAVAAPMPALDLLHGITGTLATVVGIASTYNPFRGGSDAVVASTASGETYDPESWTAAIQIDLRHDFGGVRYGRLYQPAFALVERGDKRAIVRINDVGPLRPGRVIDLNERSMRYFDPSLRLGLVHDMKITLLPGHDWTPGPVEAESRIDLASAQ